MWYSTVSTSAAGKTQGCEGIGPTHHHHPFQHASEASPGCGLKIFKVIKPRLEKIEWGLGSKLEVPPGHGRDDGDLANQHILLRLIHWFFYLHGLHGEASQGCSRPSPNSEWKLRTGMVYSNLYNLYSMIQYMNIELKKVGSLGSGLT